MQRNASATCDKTALMLTSIFVAVAFIGVNCAGLLVWLLSEYNPKLVQILLNYGSLGFLSITILFTLFTTVAVGTVTHFSVNYGSLN